MKYECSIKPGFRCADVEAANEKEAREFFADTIADNISAEHIFAHNMDTEDGNDPIPNTPAQTRPASSEAVGSVRRQK